MNYEDILHRPWNNHYYVLPFEWYKDMIPKKQKLKNKGSTD